MALHGRQEHNLGVGAAFYGSVLCVLIPEGTTPRQEQARTAALCPPCCQGEVKGYIFRGFFSFTKTEVVHAMSVETIFSRKSLRFFKCSYCS